MSLSLSPFVRQQAFKLGVSSPGATIYFFLSGTSTPQNVYDADGVSLGTSLTADVTGRFVAFFLAPLAYRMRMDDADGATIWGPEDGIAAPTVQTSGTWTPTIGGVGGTSGQTYSSRSGLYTKIGDLVFAQFYAVLTNKGTITGNVAMTGLPFPSTSITNAYASAPSLIFSGLATNWVNVSAYVPPNTSHALIIGATAAATGNNTSLVTADIGNTTAMLGQIIYRASA